jgi:hypothetical protein
MILTRQVKRIFVTIFVPNASALQHVVDTHSMVPCISLLFGMDAEVLEQVNERKRLFKIFISKLPFRVTNTKFLKLIFFVENTC